MSFLFSLALAIAAVVVGWRLWREVEDREDAALLLWFYAWLAKGVALPLAIWGMLDWLWIGRPLAAANTLVITAPGGSVIPLPPPTLPPPQDFLTPWWPRSGAEAFLLILAVWAVVNFLWLICVAQPRLEDRKSTWMAACLTGLFCLPVLVVLCAILGSVGFFWGPAAWLGILAHFFVGRTTPAMQPAPPTYSGAVGHLKLGRFDQAEEAILEQLEKTEDDYAGWLLLAELYAVHFGDLPTADRTVHDLCAQPNVNASQASVALHKLADWYLEVDDNPVAARSVLEEIELLYPHTHLAFMAGQRLRRLPATRREWEASKHAPTIRLRPGGAPEGGFAHLTSQDAEAAARRAEQLSAKLELNPNDARAREEFARLLEGALKQPAAALEQMRQLLELRGFSDEQRGEWLNLMATWQLRHQRDGAAGKQTFDRVVREHAGTAAADLAAQRLQMLELEQRLRASQDKPPSTKRRGPIRVEVPKARRPGEIEEPPPPKWD
jgi:tetratricopeptide (TPR) repeat protein